MVMTVGAEMPHAGSRRPGMVLARERHPSTSRSARTTGGIDGRHGLLAGQSAHHRCDCCCRDRQWLVRLLRRRRRRYRLCGGHWCVGGERRSLLWHNCGSDVADPGRRCGASCALVTMAGAYTVLAAFYKLYDMGRH